MQNSIDDLYKRVWITRGSRFEAHKRLNRINSVSTWNINILSVCIIGISLLALAPPVKGLTFLKQEMGSIFTAILSILILVISIMESSKGYKQKADKMHECGKELSHIYNDIKMAIYQTPGAKSVDELTKSYQEIIDKYENHLDLDRNRFKAKERKELGLSFWYYIFIEIQYAISVYYLFLFPIILVTLMLVSFFRT